MPMQKVIIDPDAAMRKFQEDMAKMQPKQADGSPVPAAPPHGKRLPGARFGLAAHFRGENLCATFPSNWTFEDVLKPDTWALVAPRAPIGSIIEVRDDNLSWFALLLVVASGVNRDSFLELQTLFFKKLEPAKSLNDERAGYRSEYRGVIDKWCITRVVDGKDMALGLSSRDEARYQVMQLEGVPIGGGQIAGRTR